MALGLGLGLRLGLELKLGLGLGLGLGRGPPSVSTATPALSATAPWPATSGSTVSKPLTRSLTESSVTGGTLGGGVLGGGCGGGGGGAGWMASRSISAARYGIDSRLMYVVDVSEKLVSMVISHPELASSVSSSVSWASVALSEAACALRLSISSEIDSRSDSAE